MKKYTVEVLITKAQYVWYEVEAESKDDVKRMIENGTLEDNGKAFDETIPEEVSK